MLWNLKSLSILADKMISFDILIILYYIRNTPRAQIHEEFYVWCLLGPN